MKEEILIGRPCEFVDQAYGSEATIEIYAQSIEIKTAWSKYFCYICQRSQNAIVYNGAYRGLLEQVLLPAIATPKEACLILIKLRRVHSMVVNIKKLREYAEDNLKLKQFRRENFNEQSERNRSISTIRNGIWWVYKKRTM